MSFCVLCSRGGSARTNGRCQRPFQVEARRFARAVLRPLEDHQGQIRRLFGGFFLMKAVEFVCAIIAVCLVSRCYLLFTHIFDPLLFLLSVHLVAGGRLEGALPLRRRHENPNFFHGSSSLYLNDQYMSLRRHDYRRFPSKSKCQAKFDTWSNFTTCAGCTR